MEATPCLFIPIPSSLEPGKSEKTMLSSDVKTKTGRLRENGPLPSVVGHQSSKSEESGLNHHPLATGKKECVAESEYSEMLSSPSKEAVREILLHQHQNDLQQQQIKIVEMPAMQQKKSNLPQRQVPIFNGDPMEYGAFVRAFENIIESKTSSSSERLYYLEQFTSGDVKELVRSCHYLPPDKGFQEAKRLIKKKFGDDYCVVTAYENKALNWLK